MSDLIVNDYSKVTVKIEENVIIKEEVYDSDDSDMNIPLSDYIPKYRGNVVKYDEDKTRVINPEPIERGPSGSSNIGDSGSIVGHVKSYACPKCDRTFSFKYSLNRHINSVHDKLSKYSRGKCNNDYGNVTVKFEENVAIKEEVYDSDNSDMNIPLSDYKPDDRGNVVKYDEDETRVMKPEPIERGPSGSSNIGESGSSVGHVKSHACPKCDRTFSYKYQLNRHINSIHDKLRKYSCGECNNAFVHEGYLKRHRCLKSSPWI